MMWVIIIIDNDDKFKDVIGTFNSPEAAEVYIQDKGWKRLYYSYNVVELKK